MGNWVRQPVRVDSVPLWLAAGDAAESAVRCRFTIDPASGEARRDNSSKLKLVIVRREDFFRFRASRPELRCFLK